MVMIIDASGAVLGRLSASVAKKLLAGEEIVVVNAARAVISGNPDFIKDKFQHRRDRGDRIKGPFYPRYPDMMLKRAIRGMLPRKKMRGRDALERLRVYKACPVQFTGKAQRFGKQVSELRCKSTTLAQLAKSLGAREGMIG